MVISFLAMFVILYLLFSTAMNSMLSEREADSMRSQTDLERNMLISSMEYIPKVTTDYALLPPLYEYVTGKNDAFYQEYLNSNDALRLYELNLMAVVTSSGEVKFEKYYRYDDDRVTLNPTDLSNIYAEFSEASKKAYENALTRNTLEKASLGVDGYISQSGFVYYLSAYPIFDAADKGLVAGTLIFGRLIDEEELHDVTHAEDSQFSIIGRENIKFSKEQLLQLDEDGFTVQPDGDTLTGYAVLGSALDKPAVLVRDKSDRDIYVEGQTFIWMIIGLIAVGCIAILIIIMNLMNKIVVRPTTNLVNEVHALNIEKEVICVNEDAKATEISELARSINSMMSRINEDRHIIEKKNENLYYNANYDLLTGLRNRFSFEDELEKDLQATKEKSEGLCVFFLDVDRLKYINDTFGHPLGDGLIKAIAQRLDRTFSDENVVARMSGDEFALCTRHCQSAEEMHEFANRVLNIFSGPFHVKEVVIEVTASLGSSLCPDDGADGVTLIKNAEIAMYHSKGNGKGLYTPYRKDFHETFQRQVFIENRLRTAINADYSEFEMYYQPKLEVETGKIELCEALIRWNSPEGMIFPDEFIPTAEDSGLIIPLTWWIMEESYRHARILREAGHPTIISINVPPQVIMHEEFLERLTQAAEREGIEPSVIDIEVTERTLLDEPELVMDVFKGLRSKGIEVSVDDFGTGYSSLSYLNRLSVNRLKIDRSFINSINEKEDGQTIILAIIAMAKNLDILTTAEGVEDGMQYWFLKKAGCDEIQGYAVCRPVPLDDYLLFLETWDFEVFEQSFSLR